MRILIIGNVVFICLLFLSCQERINTMVECKYEIKIDPEQAQDSILFSDLFEKVSYIRIPTDDDFLIGRIDKLIVSDRHIFMLDRKLSRSVFCIDKGGNKVFEIHRVGRGPGEYVDLRDIAFDSERKELLLFCYVRQKVIYFDLNGNYLREKRIPCGASSIQPLKNGGLVLFCDYNSKVRMKKNTFYPNIVIVDDDMKIVKKGAFFEGFVNNGIVWTSMPEFSCFNNVVSLKPDHCNNIYHMKESEIDAIWRLNFGKHNVGDVYWMKVTEKGMTVEKLEEFCRIKELYESIHFYENIDLIYFAYRCNMSLSHVFYQKNSGKTIQAKRLINDLDYFIEFTPKILKDNQFYGVISANDVCHFRENSKYNRESFNYLDSIKISDNPIIVIYNIKEI